MTDVEAYEKYKDELVRSDIETDQAIINLGKWIDSLSEKEAKSALRKYMMLTEMWEG